MNAESNPIFLSGCNSSAGQNWSPYSDGTLRVQGGCLDVVAAGTTSGTQVDWYACNGSNAQNWTHASNGELVNPNSNLCLTDPGGNTGTRLDIETCTGAASQIWTYPTGGGGTNTVSVTNPGNQTTNVGTAASLQINASDSASIRNRFGTGVRPTIGVPSGVIGRRPVQNVAFDDIAAAREQVVHAHFQRFAARLAQRFVEADDLRHAADANAVVETRDRDLVGLVEHGRYRRRRRVDDRRGDRIALERIDRNLDQTGLSNCGE